MYRVCENTGKSYVYKGGQTYPFLVTFVPRLPRAQMQRVNQAVGEIMSNRLMCHVLCLQTSLVLITSAKLVAMLTTSP